MAGIDLGPMLTNGVDLREYGDRIETLDQICMRPAFDICLSYLGIRSGNRKKLRLCFDVLLHDHNRV